jgi:hypothetical protein
MPDFQERAGSPFPTDLLEIHKPYERHDFQISAAIFVHIRLLVAQHYPPSYLATTLQVAQRRCCSTNTLQ